MQYYKRIVIRHTIGILLFIVVVLSLTAMIGKIMTVHNLDNVMTEWLMNLVIFIGASASGIFVLEKEREKKGGQSILLMAELILLSITISALIDGQFQNISYRIISIISAVLIICFIQQKKPRKRRGRKRIFC